MASSNLKELVNKVLRMTGDLDELTQNETVATAIGGMGKRILDFLNLTIADVSRKTNWDFLYVEETIVADGSTKIFTIPNVFSTIFVDDSTGYLVPTELTRPQFMSVSRNVVKPVEQYFTRSNDGTSTTIEFLHTPAAQSTVTVSGYRLPTTFNTALIDDNATCDFPDDILVYGSMAHLDSYDQLERGYMNLYANAVNEAIVQQGSNKSIQVAVDNY